MKNRFSIASMLMLSISILSGCATTQVVIDNSRPATQAAGYLRISAGRALQGLGPALGKQDSEKYARFQTTSKVWGWGGVL